jgi:hypothetical protein
MTCVIPAGAKRVIPAKRSAERESSRERHVQDLPGFPLARFALAGMTGVALDGRAAASKNGGKPHARHKD